jgi:hypothetical protein
LWRFAFFREREDWKTFATFPFRIPGGWNQFKMESQYTVR